MISEFEERERVLLFDRSLGKLRKLTKAGEQLYIYAKNITENYQEMLGQLRESSIKLKGKIKIGVPPLLISTLFQSVLRRLNTDNPDIKIEFHGLGAYQLQRKLLLQEIDVAVLVKPNSIENDDFEELLLYEAELAAFMDKNNRSFHGETLCWEQLHRYPLAMLDDSFMIHHHIMQEFEKRDVQPDVLITSDCWEYLVCSVMQADLVTIFPSIYGGYFANFGISKMAFTEPIPWKVFLCRRKKKTYSRMEEHVFEYILSFFDTSSANFSAQKAMP